MSFSDAVVYVIKKSFDAPLKISVITYLCHLSFVKFLNHTLEGGLSVKAPDKDCLLNLKTYHYYKRSFWSTHLFPVTDTEKTEVQKATMYFSSSERGLRK